MDDYQALNKLLQQSTLGQSLEYYTEEEREAIIAARASYELALAADEYTIDAGHETTLVKEWLERRGYRVILVAVPGYPGSGVLFQLTPREPARMAIVGDTLIYDGHTIIVRQAERKTDESDPTS